MARIVLKTARRDNTTVNRAEVRLVVSRALNGSHVSSSGSATVKPKTRVAAKKRA